MEQTTFNDEPLEILVEDGEVENEYQNEEASKQ